MPNKAAFRISRPSVWSEYTSYASVAGLHSETSPRSLARNSNIEKRQSNDLSLIEGAHKKEMRNLDKSKREMEQSMLAYSEKMKEINRQRSSLPILPSLHLAKYWSIGSDREITPSISSEKMNFLEENTASRKTSAESKDSSYRQLPPIILRSNNRKMTYHGSEGHLLDVNAIIRTRHSVSICDPSKKSEERRRRKTGIISPPSPESVRKLHGNRDSVDSGYESQKFFGDDFDSDKSSLHSDYHARTSVQISPFPDIIEEPQEISIHKTEERKNSHKVTIKERRHKEARKLRKSVGDLPEPRTNNKLLPLRKSPIHSPRKMSNAGLKKHSLLLDLKKSEEKKGPGVCQCFRYSEAMEELLKSPNPFSMSKNETVSKLEKGPDGRMMATMSAAVLTVIDIDDMQNVRGLKLNLKRHSESDRKGNLPRGELGNSSSHKISLENRESLESNVHSVQDLTSDKENLNVGSNVYLDTFVGTEMPNLAHQSNSTLTMVSVEG